MRRTSIEIGEKRPQAVTVENTARQNADKLIERGFATNFSEAVRVSLAWCALALEAYDGLSAQRAAIARRPSEPAAAGASPQSAARRE